LSCIRNQQKWQKNAKNREKSRKIPGTKWKVEMVQKVVSIIPLVIRKYKYWYNKFIGYMTPTYMAGRSSKLHLGYKYLLNDTLKKDHTSFIMTRKNE
jgi:hypothetical protein